MTSAPCYTVMGPGSVVQSDSDEFEPDEKGEDQMDSNADAEPPRKWKCEDSQKTEA